MGFFDWIGNAYNSVKSIGKKVWDKVKSVPVIGTIANAVEKYTPIGQAASGLIKGVEAVGTGVGKLAKGDIKGAIGTATTYGRDLINQKNPLLEKLKSVPVLGKAVSGLESVANNIPIYGGMSLNTMRSIGNAGLNSVDAFKEGDVGGGFKNLGKGVSGYLGSKTGGVGMAGKVANKFL